jgi:hypothetical protein
MDSYNMIDVLETKMNYYAVHSFWIEMLTAFIVDEYSMCLFNFRIPIFITFVKDALEDNIL